MMTVRAALEEVLRAPDVGYVSYAKAYASAALRLKMEGEGLKAQIPYVLSNLQYWRGRIAREVKRTLKEAGRRTFPHLEMTA